MRQQKKQQQRTNYYNSGIVACRGQSPTQYMLDTAGECSASTKVEKYLCIKPVAKRSVRL